MRASFEAAFGRGHPFDEVRRAALGSFGPQAVPRAASRLAYVVVDVPTAFGMLRKILPVLRLEIVARPRDPHAAARNHRRVVRDSPGPAPSELTATSQSPVKPDRIDGARDAKAWDVLWVVSTASCALRLTPAKKCQRIEAANFA